MARTAAFRKLCSALRRAVRDQGAIGPRAISRRGFFAASAGALALASCRSSVGVGLALEGRRIAVVGGGAAGLTAAHRLAARGAVVSVYEASARFGGRMFTKRDFTPEGQFCELGGELVDSNHTALRDLAAELGVGVDRLAPPDDPGVDHLRFEGRLRSAKDLYDPETGHGAVVPIVSRIAADQAALLDRDGEWTDRARALDQLSLKAYLDGLRDDAERWAIDFIDLAYRGEFGAPTERQSALNLVDFISADLDDGFEIFGDSDEAWRIRGGSSSLIGALQTALEGRASLNARHALQAIERDGDRVLLHLDAPVGRVAADAEAVVLALPFTRLRTVEGVDRVGLPEATLRAIRDLGMGTNAKVMVATEGRPWRDPRSALPAPSNGSFYSDEGFEAVWETSRGQPGEGGVLTNFLADTPQGGVTGALGRLRSGLAAVSPGIAERLNPSVNASFFWAQHPFTLGSYAAPFIGQYTSLLEAIAEPSADGLIQLAGEQTSVDFLGYMNGAVESGERVARALAQRLAV